MNILKNIKTGLVIAALFAATLAARAQVPFQPLKLGQAVTAGWTNRLAGGTSMTNWFRVDVSQAKDVALAFEIQGTAASQNGQFWIGRSVNPTPATATIELFSIISLTGSGSANTTVSTETNYVSSAVNQQSIGGYRYLWIGPITNTAAAGNYITNMTIYVDGK